MPHKFAAGYLERLEISRNPKSKTQNPSGGSRPDYTHKGLTLTRSVEEGYSNAAAILFLFEIATPQSLR
jgi:hypothetical protein